MPIINRIDVMLAYRKKTLKEVAEKMGISVQHLSMLKNNAKAIRFATLEKLCYILECNTNDLLEYVRDDKDAAPVPWSKDER